MNNEQRITLNLIVLECVREWADVEISVRTTRHQEYGAHLRLKKLWENQSFLAILP